MNYLKRLSIAWSTAFVVMAYYTLAVKSSLAFNIEIVLTILIASLISSFASAIISAALIRKQIVLMVVASQILAISFVAFIQHI